MYCRLCGKKVSDTARFCENCGKAVALTQNNIEAGGVNASYGVSSPVFRYAAGVLFLLGGVLPYLIRQDMAEYIAYINVHAHSIEVLAAISALRNSLTIASPFFCFASSAFSVLCGLLLLKKGGSVRKNVIACMVSHILSMLYSGIAALMVYISPQFAVSLFVNGSTASAISAQAALIIRSKPDLLYIYWDAMRYRAIISAVFVVASIAILYLEKKKRVLGEADKPKYQTVGIAVMIPVFALFGSLYPLVQSYLGNLFGTNALAANSAARSVFVSNCETVCVFLIFSFIAVSIIFNETKK